MNLGRDETLEKLDADLGDRLAALSFADDLGGVQLLTAAECAHVAALDVSAFTSSFPRRECIEPRRVSLERLLLHGLGGLIVFLLLLLPLSRPVPEPIGVLKLNLQATEARPESLREASPEVKMGAEAIIARAESVAAPAVADVVADKRQPDSQPSVRPLMSISQSKAEALQAWSETYGDREASQSGRHQGSGTVFDSALNTRLSDIAPGRLVSGAAANTLADVNGVQEVVLGDQCFHVSKLDDQAMRGMGVWTRGHCTAPDAYQEKIKIGVLP
ncbi:hypothetical protein QWY82_09335 [Simiduia curdlanivorans]|uniref:Uncharacterized protein n=1 Tax=Simiduia curdlanivorans TaxID=1492769 RepID=A0ABV8VAB2_9GAMM|nr:hypothetical protein [Simiduia curdlanivorans]MDN3639008.1 hypothetical protein [Simiduia curdlanivorans]